MIYGDIMKDIRERLGISQKKIANILNISDSLYSRYEKEIQYIPINHLIIFCDYFNISLDYIFKLENAKNYKNAKTDIDNLLAGNRLKEFRKENKITQVALAKFLNTTHSVISDYEKGKYLISTRFLFAICKKYNLSADYLIGKIDEPKYLKAKK